MSNLVIPRSTETVPGAKELANLVFFKLVPVKPADVPDSLKEGDIPGRLANGEMAIVNGEQYVALHNGWNKGSTI